MAIARKWLAARYNRPGFEMIFDYNVYAVCGDGRLMEGISSEAASLAGHLAIFERQTDAYRDSVLPPHVPPGWPSSRARPSAGSALSAALVGSSA